MKSVQHYNYTQGYDGKDDTKPTTSGGGFLYMKRYVDKMTHNMVSTLFSVDYKYKNLLDAQVVLREMDRPMCRKTVVGYLLLQLVLA